MEKTKRNLSGIYFRSQNEETKKWENVCFEDLTEKQQNTFIVNKKKKWLKSMIKQLVNTINEIGDQLDISKE